MAKKSKPQARAAKGPEKKIGPFAGGIGVAIWINTIETDDATKKVRSITIAPRRYRDSESGEWKDASSYRPADLPALIFALQKAQEYCYQTPLPGEQNTSDEPRSDDDIPF